MADERPFSWPAWIGGVLLALFVGGIGDFMSSLASLGRRDAPLGVLIGIVPGIVLVVLAAVLYGRARALALGICAGACVIALIGGLCGAVMSSAQF